MGQKRQKKTKIIEIGHLVKCNYALFNQVKLHCLTISRATMAILRKSDVEPLGEAIRIALDNTNRIQLLMDDGEKKDANQYRKTTKIKHHLIITHTAYQELKGYCDHAPTHTSPPQAPGSPTSHDDEDDKMEIPPGWITTKG